MPWPRTTRRTALTALAAVTAGSAGCLGVLSSGEDGSDDVPEDERWPVVLFDGANANARPTDVGPGDSPEIAWASQVLPEFPFHPIVRGGTVFATGNDSTTVYALHADSGEEQWTRTFDSTGIATAVRDGTLYACSGASLQALDPADGGQRWNRALAFETSTLLTPAGDRLYVGLSGGDSEGSTMACFAADSGETRWQQALGSRVTGFALGPDRVYASAVDPAEVVVLGRDSGDEIWRTRMETDSPQLYAPSFDRDRLYVGGIGLESLFAFDAASGDELWRSDVTVPTGATPTEDGLVVGGFDGTLTQVDREDGSHGWQRTLGGTLTFRPAATPSTLYVGTITIDDGGQYGAHPIRGLDPSTGETVWEIDLDRPQWTSLAVTSRGVFGAFRDGTVFRIA